MGYVPLAVVVGPAAPFKTLRELAVYARANPKKLTWATSGLGTTSHLTEEMINRELKLEMEIILYKGAVPQLTDVMGGHVSAGVSLDLPRFHGRLKVLDLLGIFNQIDLTVAVN